jgi:hypothetical protein
MPRKFQQPVHRGIDDRSGCGFKIIALNDFQPLFKNWYYSFYPQIAQMNADFKR